MLTESTASIWSCISCVNSVVDTVIWNSPFSMVTRLQAGWAGFNSQQRVEFFLSLLPGPVLGPTHPRSQRVQGNLSLEVKSQSVKLTLTDTQFHHCRPRLDSSPHLSLHTSTLKMGAACSSPTLVMQHSMATHIVQPIPLHIYIIIAFKVNTLSYIYIYI